MSKWSISRGNLFWIAALGALLVIGPSASRQVAAQQRKEAKAQEDTDKGDEEEGEDKKGEESPKVKVERGAHGKKVYRITTGFVIEGRIQKPNAFYVLERSQINYDWVALKKQFLPRILDATRRHPF